jgi:lysozyme family protein
MDRRCIGFRELGGTKFGLSRAAYLTLDIVRLTSSDAEAIYSRDYWDRVAGDRLSPSLALLVFDAAVNNGPTRSARWLQTAVGAVADGLIDDETLAAVAAFVSAHSGQALCVEFLAQRLIFMAPLPTWRWFGLGRARRLCSLPYQSFTMTGATS